MRQSMPLDLNGFSVRRPQAVALAGQLVLIGWDQSAGAEPQSSTLRSAVSADGGRTWTWLAPLDAGDRATLHGSPDGADAWLVPVPRPAAFPRLWRQVGDRWAEIPATGHPTAPGRYYAAAAGGARLAVAGPGGFGYVSADGGWHTDPRLPGGLNRVDLLSDGALTLTDWAHPHRFYLGTGSADQRNWTEIVVEVG
ncbi:hypothetical protein [Plantactinospora sp. WMMB782]|uniref:hypothetical protein n=1 Tax=Plantactinospora sp. WMMB782 TaxID=3404121 RepID=UPI003B9311C3